MNKKTIFDNIWKDPVLSGLIVAAIVGFVGLFLPKDANPSKKIDAKNSSGIQINNNGDSVIININPMDSSKKQIEKKQIHDTLLILKNNPAYIIRDTLGNIFYLKDDLKILDKTKNSYSAIIELPDNNLLFISQNSYGFLLEIKTDQFKLISKKTIQIPNATKFVSFGLSDIELIDNTNVIFTLLGIYKDPAPQGIYGSFGEAFFQVYKFNIENQKLIFNRNIIMVNNGHPENASIFFNQQSNNEYFSVITQYSYSLFDSKSLKLIYIQDLEDEIIFSTESEDGQSLINGDYPELGRYICKGSMKYCVNIDKKRAFMWTNGKLLKNLESIGNSNNCGCGGYFGKIESSSNKYLASSDLDLDFYDDE